MNAPARLAQALPFIDGLEVIELYAMPADHSPGDVERQGYALADDMGAYADAKRREVAA